MARLPALAAVVAAAVVAPAAALPGPPITGTNSWTAFGCAVTAADLLTTGQLLVQFNLSAIYTHVSSDDCWMAAFRDAQGRLQANPATFPQGLSGVATALAAMGLKFGVYSAASSVVCSGHPGSLHNEYLDAEYFVNNSISLIKYDNCGEYSYGNARFRVMADALAAATAAAGSAEIIISTEPFSLVPNPDHSAWAHYWRTGDDINADWNTILDRIDRNDKWAPFSSPAWGVGDPDMLQVGHPSLSDAEARSHFALWALAKAPLIIGADLRTLTPTHIAILGNTRIVGINQDPLGAQARKLAVNGTLVPRFAGLAPCSAAAAAPRPDGQPGFNGVTPTSPVWHPVPLGTVNGSAAFALVNNATGRCLGMRAYVGRLAPLLVPCADPAADPSQAWAFPTGANRIGGIVNLAAVAAAAAGTNPTNATALSVANSTVYVGAHGPDAVPLPDAAYGIQNLGLAPYTPEPPCDNRGCQNYDPTQSWYWSPTTGTVALALVAANIYRCYEGPCYQLTAHLPATESWCLSAVASISNDGVDPDTTTVPGVDVWGGPLSGGAWVFGALNRASVPLPISVRWSMLEAPGMGDGTAACVRELYNDTVLGVVTGGITVTVDPHDIAVLRVVPGAPSC
jgi:alpha-galactosidase